MTYSQIDDFVSTSTPAVLPQNPTFPPIDVIHDYDRSGDPPRIWDEDLKRPGCCFTRSIGDSYSKTLGVIPDPEVVHRALVLEPRPVTAGGRPTEETETSSRYVLCLSSDGLYEYMSCDTVMNTIALYHNKPVSACKALCQKSSQLALASNDKNDDTSLIIIFVS